MIEIKIPGFKNLTIEYLVLDYNGTLALDGVPYECVYQLLAKLSKKLDIYILTADTFGNVSKYAKKLSSEVKILSEMPISEAKNNFVINLGKENTIAVGNGKNDEKMLKTAALGIGLIQKEGICKDSLLQADIVYNSICDALSSILNIKRLVASLRI